MGRVDLALSLFYSHFLCLVMDSFAPLFEYPGVVSRDRQNLRHIYFSLIFFFPDESSSVALHSRL